MDYQSKYLKYKSKYLDLKFQNKLNNTNNLDSDSDSDSDIGIQIAGSITKSKSKTKTKTKTKTKIESNDNMSLVPKNSTSKNFIKLEFPDISVSQCEYSEGPVGLTFINFLSGAKVCMETRGGWPAYIDCLSTNEKQMISGINIAGGSLLGLESTTGITAECLKKYGYKRWAGYNGAIIFSGNLAINKIYPDKELGRFAYSQSDDKLYNGQVGAGLSASHGQGWGYKKLKDGSEVLALVVNNAVGSVYKNDKIIHNPKGNKEPYLPMKDEKKNTTIIVVVTNLKLDNDELKQMNQQMNVSIGESIRPFNTFTDGDIFYTCSTQKINKKYDYWNRIEFFVECSNVLKEAILNSIK